MLAKGHASLIAAKEPGKELILLEAGRPGFKCCLLQYDLRQVPSPLCALSVKRSDQNQSSWVVVRLTPNTEEPSPSTAHASGGKQNF